MPKIKPVVAMKQRLQNALEQLAEQEEVIELVKAAVQQYELLPTDIFTPAELEAAEPPHPVDPSFPYCDRSGNTWSGRGRRPIWLTEALDSGAALADFQNPDYSPPAEDVEPDEAVDVDGSIPYCDRAGNTWAGKGRRPAWLVDAIGDGASLDDFKNPAHWGAND